MSPRDDYNDLNDKITVLAVNHSQLRALVEDLAETIGTHDIVIKKMSQTQADIHELLQVFHSVKSGIVVIGWVGVFAKWAWPIVATVIGVWVYLKSGEWKKI